MRRVLTILALLACAAPAAAAIVPADPLDAWTAPAKVAAVIGRCLKPQGDDQNFSRKCTDAYNVACQKAGDETTVAMSRCTSAAYDYWRGVVAQRTQALLAHHAAPLSTYLRQSDPEWKHYIQSKCTFYALLQGTMWGPLSDQCALDVTLGRADDLLTIQQAYYFGP